MGFPPINTLGSLTFLFFWSGMHKLINHNYVFTTKYRENFVFLAIVIIIFIKRQGLNKRLGLKTGSPKGQVQDIRTTYKYKSSIKWYENR